MNEREVDIRMMSAHMIHVDDDKCVGCGLCRRDCPVDNILIADKKAVMKTQACIKCGHCVAICPKAAVTMTGFDDPPIEIKNSAGLNSQNLLLAIRNRRSIRQFKNQSIPPEAIEQIIEAGRFTPTAKNAQNVSYIVLKDEKEKYEKIALSFFKKFFPYVGWFYPMAKNVILDEDFFFKKAPVAIMVLSKDKINGALAASNMALMAESFGLGVLYSGYFAIAANYSRTLRKALDINKDKVVTTLVLGYPNVTYYRTAPKETPTVRYL